MKHQFLIIFDQLLRPLYVLLNSLKWGKERPVVDQNFVVLKFFGIGSITRIVHVMNATGIKKNQVTFITLHKNKTIIDLLDLNAVYIKTRHPLILISSLFQVIIQIWKCKQTTILDMERTSNLSGIFRLIVGIGKSCNSFYFKPRNKHKKGGLFVSMLNKPATEAIAEMFHKTYISPIINNSDHSNSNKIFVNINAGNYCQERKFPLSEYAVLVKSLYDKNPDWHFYLTGIKSEFEFVASFNNHLIKLGVPPQLISNIAGQHNLSSFVAFLKEAKLFITNDSGPLHLAYLYNIKTVGIWGPTSPELIGYQNSKQMLNLKSDLTCSPCFIHPKSSVAKYCKGDLTCFKSMNLQKMASKVLEFVEYQKKEASVI